MKKILLLLAVIAVIAVVVLSSAKKISVEESAIDSVSELGISGITLNGHLNVKNGGFVPAYVENITYSVKLEDVPGIIGNGAISGGVLKAGESKEFPFSIKLEWVPSIETALSLIHSDKTYALVEGNANIVSLKYIKLSIPFTARVNLEGYIEQFAVELPPIVSDVVDAVEGVISELNITLEDIAGVIEGMIG